MCIVEAVSATPVASQRYDEALESFVERLRGSAPAERGLTATMEESLVGGVAWILHQEIRRGKAKRALGLMPDLTDFVLSPYRDVAKSL